MAPEFAFEVQTKVDKIRYPGRVITAVVVN
jgi:hypothetical protein